MSFDKAYYLNLFRLAQEAHERWMKDPGNDRLERAYYRLDAAFHTYHWDHIDEIRRDQV